jgi:RNA polymerase sigma-70 factor (TIGR02960 family)
MIEVSGRREDMVTTGRSEEFVQQTEPFRRELLAHCYRMVGSVDEAEDLVQETYLRAWRSYSTFEGRSSLRTWLYRIATNASLRLAERRPRRVLSSDDGPAWIDVQDLGDFREGDLRWLDPYPGSPAGDPAARYDRRENVEVAFVAALQRLPATQRAVLILREVLEFPAAEVAEALGTTVAAVNSALQRARRRVDGRLVAGPQAAELLALGDRASRDLVDAFVAAWERADVDAVVALLADDARFTMPPYPAWFRGKADIGRFLSEQAFQNRWRARPITASGQLAVALYMRAPDDDRFRRGALTVISLRGGQITALNAWLDPATHRWFDLPEEWVEDPDAAPR